MSAATHTAPRRWRTAGLVLGGLLLALVLTVLLFPWDSLRGPLSRYVSEATGRSFEITRKLDVKLGWTTRVVADGVTFANPAWANEPYLVKAEVAEVDIQLWPLLSGQVVLPRVRLSQPQIGLQLEADGRRTWALGRDTADPGTVPRIGALLVDQGRLRFTGLDTDIATDFAIDEAVEGAAAGLPLSFKATGRWKKEPFTAEGRTGSVLPLTQAGNAGPFALLIDARAGATRFKANGTVANLAALDGADAAVELQGRSLADLYKFIGVVLPGTPRYAVKGQLKKTGKVWAVDGINGKLGQSDLTGALRFDAAPALPLLSGQLQSASLDFKDLGPIIGLADTSGSSAAAAATPASGRPGKVLPNAMLDFARLKTMDADVRYTATRIRNLQNLPLTSLTVHVALSGGKLALDGLDLGLAGGRVKGQIGIDGNSVPTPVSAQLDASGLQLNQLFPEVALTQSGLGKFTGKLDLNGQGNSAAQILGSANGNMAMLMGRGEISNILLEFLGLDGGEIFKFFVSGDRTVRLRCAAAAFDVQKGLMTSRTIVLDTSDTVIVGSGQISLANETLDLLLEPAPKDRSILSFRSPIKVGGTFAAPSGGPQAGALALRAGAALALGAINPLLALAATFESGPGEDANCVKVLAKAGTPLVRPRR